MEPEEAVWQKRRAQPETTTARFFTSVVMGRGVPVCKAELEGVARRQEDGQAKTRQAYLACVFTRIASMKTLARSSTGNRLPVFRRWVCSMSSVRCCA